jgi:Asp-tRNA(Asn)/Glu-tRNA(Gln) amidotransferase B subunit
VRLNPATQRVFYWARVATLGGEVDVVADPEVAAFFEAVAAKCGNPKAASNWIMTEMLRLLSESQRTLAGCRVAW